MSLINPVLVCDSTDYYFVLILRTSFIRHEFSFIVLVGSVCEVSTCVFSAPVLYSRNGHHKDTLGVDVVHSSTSSEGGSEIFWVMWGDSGERVVYYIVGVWGTPPVESVLISVTRHLRLETIFWLKRKRNHDAQLRRHV